MMGAGLNETRLPVESLLLPQKSRSLNRFREFGMTIDLLDCGVIRRGSDPRGIHGGGLI